MSIHHVSSIAKVAGPVLVLAIVGAQLDTASANPSMPHAFNSQETSTAHVPASTAVSSSVADRQNGADQRSERPAGACRVIERPKHRITYCECSSDPLPGVGSIDAAAILRLLLGRRACRVPPSAGR